MKKKENKLQEKDLMYAFHLYAGVFFLGVDEISNGCMSGRLGHFFYGRTVSFSCLDDAIRKMDRRMDELGSPEAERKLRTFDRRRQEKKDTECTDGETLPCLEYKEGVVPARCEGKKLNFLITVSWRAGGSWLGNVVWLRKRGRSRRENFCSVLELIQLIWSAAEHEERREQQPGG